MFWKLGSFFLLNKLYTPDLAMFPLLLSSRCELYAGMAIVGLCVALVKTCIHGMICCSLTANVCYMVECLTCEYKMIVVKG